MTRTFASTAFPALVAFAAVHSASAQFGAGDWMTTGFDAQRSSWVRADRKISLESMSNPGFDLFWKLKLDNSPRQLSAITPPALLDFYIGYRGFRSLGFFGGSSDRVFAVDVDLGRLEWEKKYDSTAAGAGTIPCPGGMTSAVTRPTITGYPSALASMGFGRGTPAKSGVGLPDEGAVTLQALAAEPPAPRRRPLERGPIAPNPFAPHIQYVYAITDDGRLHELWVSNGEEPDPGIPFIPPNAHAEGLIAYDGVAYVGTADGCGGVGNGVWALDLTTKQVKHWKAAAGAVSGTAGPAVKPDGTLIAAGGGGELVALAPHTLRPLGKYKTDATYTSSPVIFDVNGRDLVAIATSDGRLHLLDSALNGRALDRTEPFSAPGYAVGAISSWRDRAGTRWLLVAASGPSPTGAGIGVSNGEVKNGAIIAWKVEENSGKPVLKPGWTSRDLISPLTPVIINGVVFAVSSGEFRSNDAHIGIEDRIRQSTPAVLYALDAISGKELWNSGNTITSFVHSGGLSAGGTRVYVSTYDGTAYSFGFPIEH